MKLFVYRKYCQNCNWSKTNVATGYSRGWHKEGWTGFVVIWLWFGCMFGLMALGYDLVARLLSE